MTIEREITSIRKAQKRKYKKDVISFSNLVTKKNFIKILGDTVDTKINGKLVGLKADNVEIKEHLKKQDEAAVITQAAILDLSNKIQPLDVTRKWFGDLKTAVVYIGGFSAAVWGFIKFLESIHVIKW